MKNSFVLLRTHVIITPKRVREKERGGFLQLQLVSKRISNIRKQTKRCQSTGKPVYESCLGQEQKKEVIRTNIFFGQPNTVKVISIDTPKQRYLLQQQDLLMIKRCHR